MEEDSSIQDEIGESHPALKNRGEKKAVQYPMLSKCRFQRRKTSRCLSISRRESDYLPQQVEKALSNTFSSW
jgi:hypothetical protein